MREAMFAACLLVAGAAVTFGLGLASVSLGWVAGGVLFAAWSWMALSPPTEGPSEDDVR